MAARRTILPLAFCMLSIPSVILEARPSTAGGVGISHQRDIVYEPAFFQEDLTTPFWLYRVPASRSELANRDLEFLWSDRYRQLTKPLVPANPAVENDLDRFGRMLCEEVKNPFGFPYSDIRLIHDYLNVRAPTFRDSLYNTNLLFPGFRVYAPADPSNETNHVDTYIWLEGHDDDDYPSYPSTFLVNAEDSLTSAPGTYHSNAIDIFGPPPADVDDTGPNRWTRADTTYNQFFNHEFVHCLNTDKQGLTVPATHFLHMLSSAAEVLGGLAKDPPIHDADCRKNLIRHDDLTGNYQAWSSFAAYVAYHFRGVDLGPEAGRYDDLIWRWAREPQRTLTSLVARLRPDQCAECTTRTYFNDLSPVHRFHLLLHNWRVANFVRNFSLAEGQYGFPPQFNFDPVRDIGFWRDIDTTPAAADSFNMPNEVQVTMGQTLRELSFAGPAGGAKKHALSLDNFGADYWVVTADPSVASTNRELAIRVTPEGYCGSAPPTHRRLTVSAIGYTNQATSGDALRDHPEWATFVLPPQGLDVSLAGSSPIEMILPNFGQTHRSALIVITTSAEQDHDGAQRVFPYRLNLGLRSGPPSSPNPTAVQTETTWDDLATWSPTGNEIAYMRVGGSPLRPQIYRKRLDGTPATPLVPQGASQFYPDWSPRGDWIAFDQEAGPSGCDIYVYNPGTLELRRLTSAIEHEYNPVFSPNGQRIAYVRVIPAGTLQIRRVDLGGWTDVLLVSRQSSGGGVYSPNWSPDGQWVYFVANDSLYAVGVEGSNQGVVVPHRALSKNTLAMHLPIGSQRIANEIRHEPLACGAQGVPTFRTMALFDLAAGDNELIRYRNGYETRSPRWSVDGTRLVYSSDELAVGTASDIFVMDPGYNRAPQFTAASPLADADVFVGFPMSRSLQATDPDGEPVTYQAAYLPPGATFADGYFYWENPGPVGAEYYVVFRALDPTGGVDNRVVRYRIVTPPPGCPHVDARTAEGWLSENSILSRSLNDVMNLDVYRLKSSPLKLGGQYELRIRENELEYTILDQVRLMALDHAPDVRAFYTAAGPILGTRVPAKRVMTSQGLDVTELVKGGGAGYVGRPGDTLVVEMPTLSRGTTRSQSTADCECAPGLLDSGNKEEELSDGPPPLGVARDQAILTNTGILVQRSDGQGGWRTVKHHYPREMPDEALIDSLGIGSVRLVFMGKHRVNFIGRVDPSAGFSNARALELVAAHHTRLGNVASAVYAAGGTRTLLAPNDTLNLTFSTPVQAEGSVRDLFLLTVGTYSSASPAKTQLPMTLPGGFALAQNQPNPFREVTTLDIHVPVSSKVRVEVFDLSGRRIRVLADREFPAGSHTLQWDRRDAAGATVGPGVFMYQMLSGAYQTQRKMVVLR